MSCLGLLFNVCYYSPTETVMPLLNHCSRVYSHADRNTAENLIVPLKIAMDSVHRLDDSLNRGAQATGRQTDRRTADRQSDSLTVTQSHLRTVDQSDSRTVRQVKQADRQTGRQTDRRAVDQIDRKTDR